MVNAGSSQSGGSESGGKDAGSSGGHGHGRGDKSVEAFREALERGVAASRQRLQEVVDEAVKRRRMTRAEANELVSNLVSRGRRYTDELVVELEKLLGQARREVSSRVEPVRRRAGRAAGKAARVARDAAERPLAEADRLRRRAGVGTSDPITGYDALTAAQIRTRLGDLSPDELSQVAERERAGKARKTILSEIDRLLKP